MRWLIDLRRDPCAPQRVISRKERGCQCNTIEKTERKEKNKKLRGWIFLVRVNRLLLFRFTNRVEKDTHIWQIDVISLKKAEVEATKGGGVWAIYFFMFSKVTPKENRRDRERFSLPLLISPPVLFFLTPAILTWGLFASPHHIHQGFSLPYGNEFKRGKI